MEQATLNFGNSQNTQSECNVTTTRKRRRTNAKVTNVPKKDSLISEIRRGAARRNRKSNDQVSSIDFTTKIYADKVELVLNKDCEIVNEQGKMFVVRKRMEFPTSTQQSLKILGAKTSWCICGYNDKAIKAFYKLLVCRDAYLKLSNNYKPVWEKGSDKNIASNMVS